MEINETGLARLQEALAENRALADEAASAFSEAKAAVEAFFNEISSSSFSGEGEASVTEGGSPARHRRKSLRTGTRNT